jgi:aryl-alcohol dehydrogenase-like predicted oxidoreductase
MERRKLGDLEVSAIGLGFMRYNETAQRMIDR